MKFFNFSKKRQSLGGNVQDANAIDTYIKPFKEMPSSSTPGQESADRLNAHDLFSQFTADIIKEDTMFAR